MDLYVKWLLGLLGISVAISLFRAFPMLLAIVGFGAAVFAIMMVADWIGVDQKAAVFWTGMGVLALLLVLRLFLGPDVDDRK